MQQPPLLPEETLVRVLRVARFNGTSMLVLAGLFAVLAGAAGDFVGAMVGLIVAGAGAMEVHGGTLLTHGDCRGANWLVSSELSALVGILAYCAVRLVVVQLPPIPDELKPLIEMDAKQVGLSSTEFLLQAYRLGWLMVAVLSVIYQGGFAVYYARRRRAVTQAILQE